MPDLIKALGDTGTGTTSKTTSTALRLGSTGTPVTDLQKQLKALGYYTGAIDGSFGNLTLSAVKAYQKASGLVVDGVAGPKTQASLLQTSTTGVTATSPVVKPKAAVAGQISDGGTSTSAPVTTAPKTGTPSPAPAVTPTVTAPPIVKPQAGAQQGYADTGGNQVAAPPVSTKAPGIPQAPVPATPTPAKLPPTTQTGTGTTPVQTNVPQPPVSQPAPTMPQQPPVSTTPAVMPTVTPGAGTTPGTGTPGAPGTPPVFNAPSPDPYEPLPNPYIDQLATMKFEYDPFSDQEYLKRASDYEQQVTNMMVGRGMLYSSIGASALQASLIDLQADMVKQKYQEFLQDRDFVFQMARFTSDEDSKMYGRYMDEKNFEFEKAKEAFDQAAWQSEFELSQQKEAFSQSAWNAEFEANRQKELFDQYTWQQEFQFAKQKEANDQAIAWANYNLDKQATAFSQKMRQLEYDQQQEQLKYTKLLNEAQQDLGAAQGMVQDAAVQYSREQKLFNSYYDRYKKSGTADSTVAKYFGVTAGSSITSEYVIQKILGKSMELDMFRQDLFDSADIVGIDSSNINSLVEWYNTRYKSTATPLSGFSREVK